MAGVEVATLGWGVLQDERGNKRSGLTPTISGTVYVDQALTTPLSPSSWTSQSDGTLPGFMASGQYTFTEPIDGTSRTVDVVGGENVADAVQDNLDDHIDDEGTVHGTSLTNVRVSLEAPLNVQWAEYGAVGDGSTDDSTAFQTALTAVKASGGTVIVPPASGYKIATGLLLKDSLKGVTIEGVGSGIGQSETGGNRIVFSPATGNLLNLASSHGVTVKNLDLRCSNASYNGHLVETGDSGAVRDPSYLRFENCTFAGTSSSVVSAASLVHLNRTIISSFHRCGFYYANRAIWGVDGNYANAIGIHDCEFHNTTNPPIYKPGQAWVIAACTFEPLIGNKAGAIAGDGTAFTFALDFRGNWCGDVSADGGGWLSSLKLVGSSIASNLFGAPGSSTGTTIDLLNVSQGIHIAGNRFEGTGCTAVNFNATCRGVSIVGNDIQTTTKAGGLGNVQDLDVRGNNTGESAAIASTAALALPFQGSQSDRMEVSGTADITSVTGGWVGRPVVLCFTGTAATNGVVDGSNLKLSANLSYTPNDTLSLVYDGTNWLETGRSVN